MVPLVKMVPQVCRAEQGRKEKSVTMAHPVTLEMRDKLELTAWMAAKDPLDHR